MLSDGLVLNVCAVVAFAVAVAMQQQSLPCGPNTTFGLLLFGFRTAHSRVAGPRTSMSRVGSLIAVHGVAGATGGSLVLGAAFGGIGSLIRVSPAIAFRAGIAVFALGVSNLLGVAVRCGSLRDTETDRRWIDGSPWFWAAPNGFTLGTGLLTRVGFCSWYALPLICLMPHSITVDPIISRAAGGIVAVGGALLALAAVLSSS